MHRDLLYDSPNLRVLSFNFEPGQELPVHSHDADSEVTLMILEGQGEFTEPGCACWCSSRPLYNTFGVFRFSCFRVFIVILNAARFVIGIQKEILAKALIASRQATLELKRDGQISGA